MRNKSFAKKKKKKKKKLTLLLFADHLNNDEASKV